MSLQSVSETNERLLGRVKWFNNKAGYGFITVTDGSCSGNDVFVHHSSINSSAEGQYKYLVQGEYVEFSISKIDGGKHEYQSSNVTGIKGNKLMYETRREIKESVQNYRMTKKQDGDEKSRDEVKVPRQRKPRIGGQKSEVEKGWTRVDKK
jgi:CspA family cold shock protein